MALKAFRVFSFLILALTILESSLLAGPVEDLTQKYLELTHHRDAYLRDKHFASAELFERNRAAFLKLNERFMDSYSKYMSSRAPGELSGSEQLLAMRVSIHHQLLVLARAVVGAGADAQPRYVFAPEVIIRAHHWDEQSLKTIMEEIETGRINRGELNLSSHVKTPAQALILLKYLAFWGDKLPPLALKEELRQLGSEFHLVNLEDANVYRKTVDAIINTKDGSAFWIWQYVLHDKQKYYRPSFEACVDALVVP